MKITDIKMEKFRTQIDTDASGNRNRTQIPYEGNRSVNTVSGGRRFVHYIIDAIVFYILAFISILIISNLADVTKTLGIYDWLFKIFFIFLNPISMHIEMYFVFEYFFQQTPGKMIMKAYVINEYGNKPSLKASILRTLIRLIPFEALSCLSERGWHDEWTKTYVVQKKELDELHRLMKEQSGNHTLDALVTA